MAVKHYDVVVVGSGSGAMIVDAALQVGLSVALVEKDHLGGTCSNVGCIPSKMLIAPADRVMEIEQAKALGVSAKVERIDWQTIMGRMRTTRDEGLAHMRSGIEHASGLDHYHGVARFLNKKTIEVGGDRLRAGKMYLVAGARPLIPPIRGLDDVSYLTNETVFDIQDQPRSIVIVGGGYVACEFAHFFAAMGSRVTIVGRNPYLVPQEDTEVSTLLKERLSERMRVHTNSEAVSIVRAGGNLELTVRDRERDELFVVQGEALMVAAGRRSNADLLEVDRAGIDTDSRGYIKVDDSLRTSVSGIWAFGDIIGKKMYKHAANREALYAWHNSQNNASLSIDYTTVPRAVFTWPQIASVGIREQDLRPGQHVHIGKARYSDVAKGMAIGEEHGFAKALVNGEDGRILGFHIIGPEASTLIQEVVNVVAAGGTLDDISMSMHIHPAMPELILAALQSASHSH